MNLDQLVHECGEWLKAGGPMSDVVISSRVRLARNLAGHRFLSKASPEERAEIERTLFDAIRSLEFGKNTFYVDVEQSDPIDRQFLVERHLISRQHAEGEGCRGVAISTGETMALMINEEDHLRIQVLRRGLNLDDAWNQTTEVDAALEGVVEFAWHRQYGYLTACPTNVGTGLRVSVMLHLPALKLTNEIEKVLRAAKDMRLAIRGLYGEGTEALGDFFQVSNQVTLGAGEEEILNGFKSEVIPAMVHYEREARRQLRTQSPAALDDKVWRALGVLENARVISSEEALFLLSHLRMGILMERVKTIDLEAVSELLLGTQSAHLQKRLGRRLEGQERSVLRAEYIRKRLDQARPSNN